MAKRPKDHGTERFTALEIASVERDNKVQAAVMREHNERLDAADREHTRLAESAQKEHNDKLMFRVTLFGGVVALVVGLAGFWAAGEAHLTRINDERPFLAVDVDSETAPVAQFGSNDNPIYIVVHSTGKSPALRIHGSCEVIHKPVKDRTKFTPMKEEFNNSYLLPNRSTTLMCPAYIDGKESKDASDPVTVFGYVKYTDDLKDEDKFATPFCFNVGVQRNKFTMPPCSVESANLPDLK